MEDEARKEQGPWETSLSNSQVALGKSFGCRQQAVLLVEVCLSLSNPVFIKTIVKATVFPVVMYGCESWTTKKAEHRRINASQLWYWRRLLSVPWTAMRSTQSILKYISPEY